MKKKSNKNTAKEFDNPFANMTTEEIRAYVMKNARPITREEFIARIKEIDKKRLNDSQK